MNILGSTLVEIASEKAGIIKKEIPVVIGERKIETEKIFIQKGSLFFDKDDPSSFIFSFLGIFILLAVESKHEYYKGDFSFFNNKSGVIRYLSYAVLVLIILLIGVFDGGQFIYFQF